MLNKTKQNIVHKSHGCMASSIANTLLTVKIIINTTPDIVYSCMHMYPYRGVKKCGREGILSL